MSVTMLIYIAECVLRNVFVSKHLATVSPTVSPVVSPTVSPMKEGYTLPYKRVSPDRIGKRRKNR